ncbi:subfamily B ATP-binding cassette protein MsbA [Paenibacillus castaneae]|uniref:ABC transporter ATP-binding protein n=1 Tax=Paenibacillus castaneae TaxID=474957 RepID=UPI000C9AD058|nr:ABC transporter ATP-binding protein [Paenibacillus castaneae]NIK79480.1 subfamily B ATP-binding cassette protein MsbA [Paenibacillus castaneae]
MSASTPGIPGKRPFQSPAARPEPGSIWAMYKRMFFHVRSHWLLLTAAFFCIVSVSLLEFAVPQLTQYTIDDIIPHKRYNDLIWIGAGVLGAAILLGLFNFFSSLLMASVGQRAVYDIRNELYGHIQKLDIGFFDRNRTGDLMSRVTNDVNMLQQLVSNGMMSLITDWFTFIFVASYMLWINWQLTLVVLITFPLMIGTTHFFSKRMRAAFRKVQETVAEVSNHLQDTLSSIRLIKSFSNEEYESERFAVRSSSNMTANLNAVKTRSLFEPFIDLLLLVGLAAVLIVGAKQTMDGTMTLGTIVAFMAYLRLLQNPIRRFSRTINTIQQSAAAYERIVGILNTKPEVTDALDAVALTDVQGEVEFKNVSFAYHNEVPVLQQFNFKIEAGKITAIVGSSGAGKSTITHLMTRFYDPQEGVVTMDGKPLTRIKVKSLREHMGIVSQDIVLLNGTIRENIVYGRPDASDEEVEAASRAASAHDFIQSFPQGYDSQIGERGVKLSGGQKQRISIARAILKNPRLIILDEATSSLDTESEKSIQDALTNLLEGRTCLVIAHRLSTIQKADHIYVLDKGEIIESGTHDSLLAQQGRYSYLYELQFPQKVEPAQTENVEPAGHRSRRRY